MLHSEFIFSNEITIVCSKKIMSTPLNHYNWKTMLKLMPLTNYTCKYMTRHWPVVLLANMIIHTYIHMITHKYIHMYVIWSEKNPAWNYNKNLAKNCTSVNLSSNSPSMIQRCYFFFSWKQFKQTLKFVLQF